MNRGEALSCILLGYPELRPIKLQLKDIFYSHAILIIVREQLEKETPNNPQHRGMPLENYLNNQVILIVRLVERSTLQFIHS